MRKLLGLILFCIALTGHAQTMKLELSIDPSSCTETKIVAAIKEEYRTQLFNITMGGVKYCGLLHPAGEAIVVVDEEGIVAQLPRSAFK